MGNHKPEGQALLSGPYTEFLKGGFADHNYDHGINVAAKPPHNMATQPP